MANCKLCSNKVEDVCTRDKTSFCREHGLKCPYCKKPFCVSCILQASKTSIICPECKKPLIICPTCLKASKVSRLKVDDLSCRCGFKLKG